MCTALICVSEADMSYCLKESTLTLIGLICCIMTDSIQFYSATEDASICILK